MDAKALLKDPEGCPSVVLGALKKLLGDAVLDWEPDTIRVELERRDIPPVDGLMAKILGAQTVTSTVAWTYDHDVLFAFALACEGVPAAAEAIHHPTPPQLAWAMREITALTGKTPTDEEGFDPDTIDPALAAVLHDEGWVLAPTELSFCQEVLDRFTRGDGELLQEVRTAWADLHSDTLDGLRRKIEGLRDSALAVQLRHLADCRFYVAERERLRAQQNAFLESGHH